MEVVTASAEGRKRGAYRAALAAARYVSVSACIGGGGCGREGTSLEKYQQRMCLRTLQLLSRGLEAGAYRSSTGSCQVSVSVCV